jgi:hypothetical protein
MREGQSWQSARPDTREDTENVGIAEFVPEG